MDTRRKHGSPFWFAVVLIVMPVLYAGSFGPAAWIASRTSDATAEAIFAYYLPLGFVGEKVRPLGYFLEWYGNLFFDDSAGPPAPPAEGP